MIGWTVLLLAGCGAPASQAPAPEPVATESAKRTPEPSPAESATPMSDPVASTVDFKTLAGDWRVTGVVPGEGVQALVRDDPAYVGKVVTFGPELLAWRDAGADGANLTDRCAGPVTQRLTGASAKATLHRMATQMTAIGGRAPNPHAVECMGGNWGPEAAGGAILLPLTRARLAMTWYDGGTLILERAR